MDIHCQNSAPGLLSPALRRLCLAVAGIALTAGLCLPPAQAQSPSAPAGEAPADSTTRSAAPSGPSTHGLWAAAGLGGGSVGTGALAQLTFRHKAHLFTARTAITLDWEVFGPYESAEDVGLLYGRRLGGTPAWLHVSGSAGLALVRAHRSTVTGTGDGFFQFTKHETTASYAVGLPVQARLSAQSVLAGVGVTLFGNLNTVRSFGGVAVTLELGKLR